MRGTKSHELRIKMLLMAKRPFRVSQGAVYAPPENHFFPQIHYLVKNASAQWSMISGYGPKWPNLF